MAEVMEQPHLVLRVVDLLIVALCKHLDHCDPEGLQLRVEYGTILVQARARCWITCIEPSFEFQPPSYRPLVTWLVHWGQWMFAPPAAPRLAQSAVLGICEAAQPRHPQLAQILQTQLSRFTDAPQQPSQPSQPSQ